MALLVRVLVLTSTRVLQDLELGLPSSFGLALSLAFCLAVTLVLLLTLGSAIVVALCWALSRALVLASTLAQSSSTRSTHTVTLGCLRRPFLALMILSSLHPSWAAPTFAIDTACFYMSAITWCVTLTPALGL